MTLVTAEQVAERLQVSLPTIRRWTRAGVLPTVPLPGRVVRYDHAAIDEWVASRAVPAEPHRRAGKVRSLPTPTTRGRQAEDPVAAGPSTTRVLRAVSHQGGNP